MNPFYTVFILLLTKEPKFKFTFALVTLGLLVKRKNNIFCNKKDTDSLMNHFAVIKKCLVKTSILGF